MPAKSRAQARTTSDTTPVSEWKVSNEPLDLPSGKRMKVRKSGFQTWMKAGIIPNSLMSLVQSAIDKGKADIAEMDVEDPTQVSDLLEMIDKVVIFAAEEPEVHATPKNKKDRSRELLYVDEVDDTDKMFIFNFLSSGVRDVEQFRREQDSLLESVPGGKDLGVPA